MLHTPYRQDGYEAPIVRATRAGFTFMGDEGSFVSLDIQLEDGDVDATNDLPYWYMARLPIAVATELHRQLGDVLEQMRPREG